MSSKPFDVAMVADGRLVLRLAAKRVYGWRALTGAVARRGSDAGD